MGFSHNIGLISIILPIVKENEWFSFHLSLSISLSVYTHIHTHPTHTCCVYVCVCTLMHVYVCMYVCMYKGTCGGQWEAQVSLSWTIFTSVWQGLSLTEIWSLPIRLDQWFWICVLHTPFIKHISKNIYIMIYNSFKIIVMKQQWKFMFRVSQHEELY